MGSHLKKLNNTLNVNNGMVEVMFAIIDRYIGEREIFLDKNKKEFTQMITFSVSDNEDSSNIVQFIIAVSEVNPLYAVRILK